MVWASGGSEADPVAGGGAGGFVVRARQLAGFAGRSAEQAPAAVNGTSVK